MSKNCWTCAHARHPARAKAEGRTPICKLWSSGLAFIADTPAAKADEWKRANSRGGGLTTLLLDETSDCPAWEAQGPCA
jgi:hypothetical protein